MIKTAVIGCGGMGNHHARVLAQMANVKVVGVCDPIEAKARPLGEAVGVPWCVDYRTLLERADAVWICTEPFNRLAVVTDAAAAGKHIFTEKPIARDLREADAMIAAAARARVKYMLGYVLRFTNPYRLLRDTLAAGELGELVSCWTRRFMPIDMSTLWYGWQEKSGGVLLDFGSHDLDWLLWLGGPARTVFTQTFRVRPTMHADEHAQTVIVFERGGIATCEVSWSSYLSESSVGVVGTRGAMIVGLDGKVRKRVGDGKETVVDVESAMAVDPAGNVGQRAAAGGIETVAARNETIQQHFFRCIEEDLDPIPSAAEGRQVLATVLAMHKSARTGRSVVVAGIKEVACRPLPRRAARAVSGVRG